MYRIRFVYNYVRMYYFMSRLQGVYISMYSRYTYIHSVCILHVWLCRKCTYVCMCTYVVCIALSEMIINILYELRTECM